MKVTAINKISRTFVRNVALIRRENEMSVAGFARATGLAESTIRRIERARKTKLIKGSLGVPYSPKLSTVLKMADAIGATPDQLLLGKL